MNTQDIHQEKELDSRNETVETETSETTLKIQTGVRAGSWGDVAGDVADFAISLPGDVYRGFRKSFF